jgi:hypothetical protein
MPKHRNVRIIPSKAYGNGKRTEPLFIVNGRIHVLDTPSRLMRAYVLCNKLSGCLHGTQGEVTTYLP